MKIQNLSFEDFIRAANLVNEIKALSFKNRFSTPFTKNELKKQANLHAQQISNILYGNPYQIYIVEKGLYFILKQSEPED